MQMMVESLVHSESPHHTACQLTFAASQMRRSSLDVGAAPETTCIFISDCRRASTASAFPTDTDKALKLLINSSVSENTPPELKHTLPGLRFSVKSEDPQAFAMTVIEHLPIRQVAA